MSKWRRAVFPALTILTMLFIFTNSLTPADEVVQTTGFFSRLLQGFLRLFYGEDYILGAAWKTIIPKLGHVGEFFLFSLFFSLSIFERKIALRHGVPYVLLAGLFVAVCDEHLQLYTKGRNSSVTDVLIDFSGVILGLLFTLALIRLHERWQQKRKIETDR